MCWTHDLKVNVSLFWKASCVKKKKMDDESDWMIFAVDSSETLTWLQVLKC